MISAWVNEFVGIPFLAHGRTKEGLDCWGLVKLVFAEVFGIDLPEFVYADPDDRHEIAQVYYGADRSIWKQVYDAQDGDLIVIGYGKTPRHFGVVCGKEFFIHIRPGTGVAVERWSDYRYSARVVGFGRHISRWTE